MSRRLCVGAPGEPRREFPVIQLVHAIPAAAWLWRRD